MKKVFTAILLFVALQSAAQDTIIVYINKVSAAAVIIKNQQPTADLPLKKVLLKKAKQFTVQIKTEWLNNKLYVRHLGVESDSTEIVAETKDKPGHFDLYTTYTKKKLLAGKTVKLYLQLDPANPKMKMASRSIYAGTVIIK